MPPFFSGAFNSVVGATTLFGPTNKAEATDTNRRVLPEEQYKSSMSDEEIIVLTRQWENFYRSYYYDIQKQQEISYNYWLGKHATDSSDAIDGRVLVDNLIFEATETFLPIATRNNPDPVVSTDDSPEGQKLSYDIKNMLVFQADKQKLRMKLKSLTRDWALYKLGCVKVDWNNERNDIKTEVIPSKRLILDRDGHVDEGGIFRGEYIGERKKISASKLAEMFPRKKAEIKDKCKSKMATKLEITEWWYKGTDVFFTLEDICLGKFKNPHWNYDGDVPLSTPQPQIAINADLGEEGDDSAPDTQFVEGKNHLDEPSSPYIFLTVFNTRIHPHDDTSLILQNLPLQDLINKRMRQIDKNVESQNNGLVVSEVFTSEQAGNAAAALRRGGAIRVPAGDVTKAFLRDAAPALPPDVFANLADARKELRNIYGTSGSTPEGQASEDTARGKILVNQLDSSRIGGGVTEYIEQVADSIYNYWVQMMYVHYDEPHYASAIGMQGALEVITLHNSDLNRTIMVTVKEGSLIPKDPLTQRNEAVDLWSANAIDPITLYTKLDYPDPYEAAKQLLLWQMIAKGVMPPQMMFPDFPQGGVPMQLGPVPAAEGGGGTGGPAVNAPTGNGMVENQQPAPASPQAEQIQGKQLMQSVPIK